MRLIEQRRDAASCIIFHPPPSSYFKGSIERGSLHRHTNCKCIQYLSYILYRKYFVHIYIHIFYNWTFNITFFKIKAQDGPRCWFPKFRLQLIPVTSFILIKTWPGIETNILHADLTVQVSTARVLPVSVKNPWTHQANLSKPGKSLLSCSRSVPSCNIHYSLILQQKHCLYRI